MEEPPIMDRLRKETRDLHDEIEAVSFHVRLADGGLTREEYISLLEALSVVHTGLELYRARASSELAPIVEDLLCLKVALTADQQEAWALNIRSFSDQPARAAENYIRRLHEQTLDNPLTLLGHLYVNHGSLLGGFHLRPLLSKSLNWPPERMRYFGGLGASVAAAWRAFRQKMNQADFTSSEADQIVNSARGCFEELIGIYESFPVRQEAQHQTREVG